MSKPRTLAEREVAWLNSPLCRAMRSIDLFAFRLAVRYARRANGEPFAKASAQLTAQAESILHAWQHHLLTHGSELTALRAAGVGEAHIATLYPDATRIAAVAADFSELAARPEVRRILRRASWWRLSEGSGVVPTYSPAFDREDQWTYLDLAYATPRKKPAGELLLPFIFLSLAKPGAYPPGKQHQFNLGLRHMRYLLRVADSLTPHLTPVPVPPTRG